jgi:uncharacterized protein YgiM (DUF1202 family)
MLKLAKLKAGAFMMKKYLTGLSRTLFAGGLLLVLTSSLGCSKVSSINPFKGDPTVQVQSSTVNIRQSATTNSKIITTVKRGDKLKVTDKTESWYKIKTKAGKTGWVHASLVK